MGLLAGLAHLAADTTDVIDDSARIGRMCAAMRHRAACEPRVVIGSGGGIGAIEPATGDVLIGVDSPTVSVAAVRAAYKTKGEGVFRELCGPFAIAIWDVRERTLLLGRDHAGIKPLHYTTDAERLFFASEIKGLLTNPEIDRAVDPSALDHYLAFLLTPRDQSIYREIKKLPPAHYLKMRNGSVSVHEYWQLPLDNTFEGTEEDAIAELAMRLRQACRSTPRLISLSGGLNASLAAAIATAVAGAPPLTVTVVFDKDAAGAADVAAARDVAAHLAADHHQTCATPDIAILDRIIAQFDEPFADASAIPTWYVAQAVRLSGTDAVFGDGDEIFGGCERYLPAPRVAQFDRIAGHGGRALAGIGARLLPPTAPGHSFLRHVALDDRARYVDSMRFWSPEGRRALLSADVRTSAEAAFGAPFDRSTTSDWQTRMMAFDYTVELPEDALAKRDRVSMAHGLECHFPLLDDAVVELAATLPPSMKIRRGRLKHILRAVASRYLPASIVDRPKHGFGLSPERWLGAPLGKLFGDVLGSAAAKQRGIFNQAAVDALVREHRSGTRTHEQQLWLLLVFELWHRQHQSPVITSAQSPVISSQQTWRPVA